MHSLVVKYVKDGRRKPLNKFHVYTPEFLGLLLKNITHNPRKIFRIDSLHF